MKELGDKVILTKEIKPPFKLSSDKIYLIPLTENLLKLYVLNDGSLETELKIKTPKIPFSETQIRNILPHFNQALIERIIPAVTNNPENYLFYTVWLIVCVEKQIVVGGISIKGAPNEFGEIEIGYGTDDGFKKMGYMSETVNLLSQWALEQAGVKIVTAETNIENIASHKVLQNNNFVVYKKTEQSWWWSVFRVL